MSLITPMAMASLKMYLLDEVLPLWGITDNTPKNTLALHSHCTLNAASLPVLLYYQYNSTTSLPVLLYYTSIPVLLHYLITSTTSLPVLPHYQYYSTTTLPVLNYLTTNTTLLYYLTNLLLHYSTTSLPVQCFASWLSMCKVEMALIKHQ